MTLWERSLKRLERLLAPVRFRDEDEHRIARLLCLLLPCIMLGMAVTAAAILARGQYRTGLSLLACVAVAAIAMWLTKRGSLKTAIGVLLFSPLYLAAYMWFNGQGIHNIAIVCYPVLIFLGGLLLKRRLFLLFTLMSLAAVVFLVLAEILHSRPPASAVQSLAIDAMIIGAIMAVAAITARLVTSDLQGTIDKARQSQQALRDSERQYRQLVDNTLAGIYIVQNQILVFCNRRLATMFGYEETEEMTGMSIRGLIAPESWERVNREFEQRSTGIKELSQNSFICIRRDGARFIAEEMGMRILFEGQPAVQGIMIDVTQRLRAETSLRESEERFRRLAEASFEGIAITLQGKVVDLNSRFAHMLGDSLEEMIGKDIREFVAPADRSRVGENIASGLDKPYEFKAMHKKGVWFPVEARGRTIPFKGKLAYVIALKDMTAAKKVEEQRRRFEIQMREVQKLESLGTLAGSIAHDFNNILSIILGYTSILSSQLGDPQKAAPHIATITDAVDRGASLVKQILTFARKTQVELRPVNVNQIIADLVRMLKGMFPKTIEIYLECDNSLPTVALDSNQLHQALLNLCINARDAMKGNGKLIIDTVMVSGTLIAKRFPDAGARNFVQIRVADNGMGMSEAVRQRIFEPFFTTKERGQGTGLGLSVVFGVVQAHNGFIDVESQLDKGTTFYLYFPILEAAEAEPAKKAAAGAPPRGKEAILVAEDEPEQLELLKMVLEGAGYKVISALDGATALATFQKPPEPIDLVLTDRDLPRVNGIEMSEAILAQNPAAKIILVSGFLETDTKSYLQNLGVREFLPKPYRLDDLLTILRRVLDEP